MVTLLLQHTLLQAPTLLNAIVCILHDIDILRPNGTLYQTRSTKFVYLLDESLLCHVCVMMCRRSQAAMLNGRANRAWFAAVEVQAAKRKSSSNEQPVALWCGSLLLESQFSNEVFIQTEAVSGHRPLRADKYLSV